MAAILGNSTTIVHTRPWAIPLATITMRKSIHGFPLVSFKGMGLRFAALQATGAPLWLCSHLQYLPGQPSNYFGVFPLPMQQLLLPYTSVPCVIFGLSLHHFSLKHPSFFLFLSSLSSDSSVNLHQSSLTKEKRKENWTHKYNKLNNYCKLTLVLPSHVHKQTVNY